RPQEEKLRGGVLRRAQPRAAPLRRSPLRLRGAPAGAAAAAAPRLDRANRGDHRLLHGEGPETWLQLHESSGHLRLRPSDLRPCTEQRGSFFYGALCKVAVARFPAPDSPTVCFLNPGTALEIRERQVVDGVLRLRLARESMRGLRDGWVSEFKRCCFDPRLGGAAQVMRLRGRPKSWGQKGTSYAFAC
ncbi:unnamed protein product, partial [Effrenium voratum]